MLQAFLVLPAFAAVWLLAAPVGIWRRLRDLALAGVALVVSAGWWVLVVELWPADARPYIGGSQTNSVLELVFGYNGLGRLTGDEVGSVGGGGMGAAGQTGAGQAGAPQVGGGGWGETGLTRLFDSERGGQASWLIPAAVVLLGALLWQTRRAPRTDRLRTAALVWGGWLVVTAVTFSLMAGIFHDYYVVALAPAIAALVGTGAAVLWRRRAARAQRITIAAVLALTAAWAFVLLRRTPEWQPWLAWTVLGAGAVAVLAVLAVHRLPRLAVVGVAALAMVVASAGPAGYALAPVATPHTGAIPTAGPEGGGGLLDAPPPAAAAVELVGQDASAYTWAAAAVGSNNAAAYQLATGDPVMALGGYNGTDPSPTLEQFQQLVAAGQIHWFVGGTGPGGTQSGGSDASRRIAEWVAATFPPTTVDGVQLYDLTGTP